MAGDSEMSFAEALAKAKVLYSSIDGADTAETATYWVFPVREVGCRAVVVDKASGRTTPLGSAWDLERWLWAYEKGLVTEEPVDLIVEEVEDLDGAAEILGRLRISPPEGRRAALQSLPAVFTKAVTWMALGELFADGGRSFKWRIRRPE